ncbi:LysR family transcriptional regulator [Vitiosangium sp. GDMCC 1.1324]|uniref:LysR family transcriptional regulator n=1 Tax=Vitiosangium sp. (strain GDMCC 1.1324) TaxID=2138576 RepID=UPI000D3762DC|nr:LysR family transcriptional regulator [Vitiosangium sp. GDMCC 1.1324]PTL81656.1 LysR family transcriptional regulator [Vitiosangium sp. GDMCC 1.1324]
MDDIAPPPSPRLDVRDLRVVLALASAGTTAQAASVLHLTQPAVSRALLAAEDKLGTRLFDRTPRGLVPTAAGQRLVTGATRLLVELGDLEHLVRTPVTPPRRIRLVCECYTAYHWLPSTLMRLRKSLPELEVVLAVDHSRAPVAALEAGELDVALITTSVVPRGRLEERPIFSDEVVFIMSASHPLAARKTLTPADLREHTLLTGQAASAESHWFMSSVFGRARPQLHFERLPLTEAILDVTRAGMGIAVLSEWIASPHLDRGDLVAKRLASGPLRRPWRLAWRREVDDAALRLLSALESTAPRRLLAG